MDVRALRYFVAVAEERHFGRAAARLHMTQPPLSRAIRQLESDLGVTLLERTSSGASPTVAGETLLVEGRMLLEQLSALEARVRGSAPRPRLVIGSLADTADLVGSRLVAPFRQRHPNVSVTVHEFDLSDPTAGVRSGVVDLALTRTPFDASGLRALVIGVEQVGVVVTESDPISTAESVAVDRLTDRKWIRLPETCDAEWSAYWTGPAPDLNHAEVRTIQECLQMVLWEGLAALAPVDQLLPPGLVIVPASDREPSLLVLVCRAADHNPLVRSFLSVASRSFGRSSDHRRDDQATSTSRRRATPSPARSNPRSPGPARG